MRGKIYLHARPRALFKTIADPLFYLPRVGISDSGKRRFHLIQRLFGQSF